ncbi:conserved hypothetical protein [Microcystis aeruginosa PCC 9806]|nr:conserved hypothetical protein [Microcystis aeruginosa PCC 9806]
MRSQIFPGLWLDKNALLMGDLVKVLLILQRGLETPEHQDFVNKLTSDRPQV